MEEIIIKKYKAFDGTLFDTISECQEYEHLNRTYVMYDMYYNIVKNPNYCYFLYLPKNQASIFISDCNMNGLSAEGIYKSSYGFYYWDAFEKTYYPITLDMIKEDSQLKDLLWRNTNEEKN